jgi:hypothetical protein
LEANKAFLPIQCGSSAPMTKRVEIDADIHEKDPESVVIALVKKFFEELGAETYEKG